MHAELIERPDYAEGQTLSVYNVATWGELYGKLVEHDEYGIGEVTRANAMSKEAWVRFDDGLHTLPFDKLDLVSEES